MVMAAPREVGTDWCMGDGSCFAAATSAHLLPLPEAGRGEPDPLARSAIDTRPASAETVRVALTRGIAFMLPDRRHVLALALAALAATASAADPLVFVTAFAPGEQGGI